MAAWAQGLLSRPINEDLGLKCIYSPPSGMKTTVDIFFIHGLQGHWTATWTSPTNGVFWPREFLSEDFTTARIFSFSYDASVIHILRGTTTLSLRQQATNLMSDLNLERVAEPGCPLIFIAHNLGGLLAEETILVASQSAQMENRAIASSTIGLMFFGTPFYGANLAAWGSFIQRFMKYVAQTNEPLMNVLERNSEVANNLHSAFQNYFLAENQRINVAFFYEEYEIPGAGLIVDQRAAVWEGYFQRTVPADHRARKITSPMAFITC